MSQEAFGAGRFRPSKPNDLIPDNIQPVLSSPQRKQRKEGDTISDYDTAKISPRLTVNSRGRFTDDGGLGNMKGNGGLNHRNVNIEERINSSESDPNGGGRGINRSGVPGWPDRGRSPLLFPPPTVDGQPPRISPRTNKVTSSSSGKVSNNNGPTGSGSFRNSASNDSAMPPVSRSLRWGGSTDNGTTSSISSTSQHSLLPPSSSSSSSTGTRGIVAQSGENNKLAKDSNTPEGMFLAQKKGKSDAPLVVYRSPTERNANPERLNLDKRHLTCCPVLRHEERVRLLNYQNNYIVSISNLEGLPNLIFLDLYNNSIEVMGEALSCVPTLRVLMLGKNRISRIANLERLSKLDVLDLHSNDIATIEGLSSLSELRVLNLAGNKIEVITGVGSLSSLTELNVRRNKITVVLDDSIDKLFNLQRIFMSNNQVSSFSAITSLLSMKHLLELTLDGNPIATNEHDVYRRTLLSSLVSLRDLDLKKVSDSDRKSAVAESRKLDDKRRQDELAQAEEFQKRRQEELRQEAILAAAGAWVSGQDAVIGAESGSGGLAAATLAAAQAAQDKPKRISSSKVSPRVTPSDISDRSKTTPIRGGEEGGFSYSDEASNGSISLTPLLFPEERRRPTVVVPSIASMPDTVNIVDKNGQEHESSSNIPTSMNQASRFNPQQHRPSHRELHLEGGGGGAPVLDSERRVGFFEFEPPIDHTTDKGARSLLIYGNAWECLDLGRSLLNVTRLMVKYVGTNSLLENLIPHLDAFPKLVSIEFSENALESFNQMLSILTVRQFRNHSSLSELTISENAICNLGLLRLFVTFNMGISLQKFNGTMIEESERVTAYHLFSPLYREVSNTKFNGEIPSSPIPPKRSKSPHHHSSNLLTEAVDGGGLTLPNLTRDPSSSTNGGNGVENSQEQSSFCQPSIVWKPFRTASKLMTFELNECARDVVSKSFSRAIHTDATAAKFEQAWIRAVNMFVSSSIEEIESGSGEDLFEKVVQPRRR